MGRPPVAIALRLVGVRANSHADFIRAVARVRFTDLIDERSALGSEVVLGASVIGRRSDGRTISNNVDAAAISWVPAQSHNSVAVLPAGRRTKGNAAATAAGVSANQPVTGNSEIIDQAEEIVIARMFEVDVTAAAHRRDPALTMQRGIFVESLVEVFRPIVRRGQVTHEEAGRTGGKGHCGREGVDDEGVRALILHRASDRRQERGIAGITVIVWITPNTDRGRRPIDRWVWENRSSPSDAD